MPPTTYPTRGAWLFRSLDRDFDFWPTLESISITQEHPEMIATLTCSVVDQTESLAFQVQDRIRVSFAGTRIFVGHIKQVEEASISEVGPRLWNITCQDYTAMMGKAIIKRRKKRKKERVRRRVRWILNQLERRVWNLHSRDLSHLPDENIEAYDYFGDTVEEALEHVADEVGMHFYIDFDNTFQMIGTEQEPAPIDLNNQNPNYSSSFPFREFTYLYDNVDQANVIMVEPEKRKHTKIVKDRPSIVAYGRQERFHSDENLHRRKQARNFGEKLLAKVKDPKESGGMTVHEPGIEAGQWVDVVEGLWDHDMTRFVKSVEINALDPHDEDGKAYLVSHITIADRRRRRRRRDNSINKNTRRRGGHTADTDDYLLDSFNRTVTSPAVEEGDSLTRTPLYYKLTWGENPAVFDSVAGHPYLNDGANFGPTWETSAPIRWVHGVAGAYNTPHTGAPCGIGPGAWSGWVESEQWIDLLVIPEWPADMAGIFVDVHMGLWSSSPSTAGAIMYVRNSAPVMGRSGFPCGIAAGNTTTTIFIPPGQVPLEGEHLWVGVGPNWNANYESMGYTCSAGYTNPTFTGYANSGRIQFNDIDNPRWAATGDTIPDLGETAAPKGAPWGEPWTWRIIGIEGAPTYGMDGNAWYVEGLGGVGIGLLGEREDEDAESGPWSDSSFGIEFDYEINTLGDTATIELSGVGEGEQSMGRIDMNGDSISVFGPTSTDSGEFLMSEDVRYTAQFDTRSGKVRGKAWLGGSPQPADWNVECAMDETEDDADRLVLWIRCAAGQRIRIPRIRIMNDGWNGRRVVRELCGFASGVQRTFTTRMPFREGSLRVHVNGIGLPAKTERGDDSEYELSFYPTAGAPIRNTYIIDQGTGDE